MNKKILIIIIIIVIVGILGGSVGFLWRQKKKEGEKEVLLKEPPKLIEIENLPSSIRKIVWTEDGKKAIILNSEGIGLVDFKEKVYRDLYKIPKKTEDSYLANFSWNKDATKFCFTRAFKEGNKYKYLLNLFSLKTGSLETIIEREKRGFSNPKISPDGNFIIYGEESIVYETKPYLIEISSKKKQSLAKDLPKSLTRWNIKWEWMPDSQKIVYLLKSKSSNNTYELKEFDLKTRSTKLLFTITSFESPNFKISPDGKYFLLDLVTDKESGRHLWVYDLEKNQKIQLTKTEGEVVDINYASWCEEDTLIVTRSRYSRYLDRKQELIVFFSLNPESQKIYPIELKPEKNFLTILRFSWKFFIPEEGLWFSKKREKAKFFVFNSEKNRFQVFEISLSQFLSPKEFFAKKREKVKFINYRNEELGVSFQYPSFFGEVQGKDYEDFKGFKFFKLGREEYWHYCHLRVTSLSELKRYVESGKIKESSQFFHKLSQITPNEREEVYSRLMKEPCPIGPFGSIVLMAISEENNEKKEISSFFPERSFELALKYISLMKNSRGESELYLKRIGYLLSDPFLDALPGVEKVEFVSNKDKSLVGIGFISYEGFDVGATTYYEAILTFPEENEKIIVIKIPLSDSETISDLSGKIGYEAANRMIEIWTKEIKAGIKRMINTLELIPKKRTVSKLSPQKREMLKSDIKYKIDLEILASAIETYHEVYHSYPVVKEMEKLTKETLEQSALFDAFKDFHFRGEWSPWNFQLDPGDYYGYWSDGNTYRLTAFLKNTSDPECVMEGNRCVYKIENGKVVSKKEKTQ